MARKAQAAEFAANILPIIRDIQVASQEPPINCSPMSAGHSFCLEIDTVPWL